MHKLAALVILLGCLVAGPAGAQDLLGPREVTSVDEIAHAIAGYFPKVKGEVKTVQGDQVTIGLGKKDGLLPGMTLTLWRDGKELLHPVTKAVLGRAEEQVGTAEIQSITDNESVAVLKNKVKQPAPGDKARITPRQVQLGIIPLQDERPEVVQGLGERLNELGRFSVLSRQKTDAVLGGRAQRDASLVRELISRYDLDAVAAVGVYPAGEKLLVTVRVFSGPDAAPVDTFESMLTLATKREALGDVRPYFAPRPETAAPEAKVPDLPLPARYVALADLDGDGALEYVFSDEKKLAVYRLEAAGWKEVWTEKAPSGEKGMQQFSIAAADVNGNGRPEIFVTRMLDGRPSSYAVEFRDGSYRRIAEVPGFLRALMLPGRGAVLIGQESTTEQFFSGEVREYAWSGGAYVPGAPLPLPKEAGLYSFVIANLGEQRPLVAVLDKENRLAVYAGDTVVWRSEEKYPVMDTKVIPSLSGLDASVGRVPSDLERAAGTSAASLERGREVRIPGRILACDIDGNGTEEIVLPKNRPLSFLGGFEAGALEGLGWTGVRLEPRWTVRELPGPVQDIQMLRQEGGACRIYALVQRPGGLFAKNTYRLEWYAGK